MVSGIARMSGYEKTYELVRPLLRDADFAGAILRLGLTPLGPDRPGVEFLGRAYEITRGGIFPADGKPARASVLSVLVYYAVSKGSSPAENAPEEFALLHYFTGPYFSSANVAAGWMTRPLVETYKNDYPKFAAVAEKFGMLYEGSPHSGEHSWRCRILPRIPLRLVYREADEEYPCEFRIYYEKRAGDFLEFEQLAFLTGCFVHALAE